MPIRRAHWVILGEDLHHLNFVYHWLIARSVPRGAIFKREPPAGRRAGDQYVRARLPEEIAALRRRGREVVLVVVTDADTLTVEERIGLLGDLGAERERVVLLIPRRNIETWIAALHGECVDETTDYKPRSLDACRLAAQRLAALAEPGASAPPSLRRAWHELARLRVP